MKKIKGMLKNQKGLTLVELLAVVVILGIIAAIAVPSIGGIIDNSKKDAHIANAEQMVSAARLAVTSNDTNVVKLNAAGTTVYKLTLQDLITNKYLEEFEDPDAKAASEKYDATNSFVKYDSSSNSYVVFLDGITRDVGSTGTPISAKELDRNDIK